MSLGMSLTRNGGGLSEHSVDHQHWQELLRSNPFSIEEPDQLTKQPVTLQACLNEKFDVPHSDEEDVQNSDED